MKKILLLTLFAVVTLTANSQTNVSGGIYTSTTWTKANSPYIVTDTVVVFPGVALTIEPGVVVKFADSVMLEIRQAGLIANGTSVDSITFTSNSSNPHPNSWNRIFLNMDTLPCKFNYCNFRYAGTGLHFGSFISSLIINNSTFTDNVFGFSGVSSYNIIVIENSDFSNNTRYGISGVFTGTINHCTISHNLDAGLSGVQGVIKNSVITYNKAGIGGFYGAAIVDSCVISHNLNSGVGTNGQNVIRNCVIDSNGRVGIALGGDTVINCEIKYNGIGISGSGIVKNNIIENDSIGIYLTGDGTQIHCNKICNNTTYDLRYNGISPNNTSVANNYWCTSDSATIAAKIYDGFDDITKGLVSFLPVDTTQCYLNTSNCSALFVLYPDTVLHHYFALNMANGNGPLTCLWNWGDGTSDTIAYPTHTYASAGFYTICLSITDSVGCSSTYCNEFSLQRNTNAMVYVNVVSALPTGISQIRYLQFAFRISPNPATNSVTISIDESMIGSPPDDSRASIATVSDVTGRKMAAVKLETRNTKLETLNFANGVYFVTVSNGGGSVTKKLVISK